MNNSMISAMSSMNGLQQRLDILANNIANVNTAGYKRKEASFQDVLTTVQNQTDEFNEANRLTPLGLPQGWGSRLVLQQTDFSQGTLQQTDHPYDVALNGKGLFEVAVPVTDANGNTAMQRAFTRSSAMQLVPYGQQTALADASGNVFVRADGQPAIVPDNRRIEIDAFGNIQAYNDHSGEAPENLGQLKVVAVDKPELLQPVGENLYIVPVDANTGMQMLGVITDPADNLNVTQAQVMQAYGISVHQGYVEQSNVDMAKEMTDLISIQRAYQLNARALSSADTLMNLANNLRGS
ncbi:flagellar hook-basal body protein [Marinicrinis lubricantis]|uniref:Flagellar hook-basal body protein n=1 Tax=Marinicrinis lubricantis TaxID=2086470 RepID=A0ABW1IKE7_9BACL